METKTNTLGFTTGLSDRDAESFWCDRCNYRTRDAFTIDVINDLTGCCPECDKQAADYMFIGRR